MSKYCFYKSFCIVLLSLAFFITLHGCASQPTELPKPSRLRIVNDSSTAISDLVVRFPEDRISFGDVPAGVTTEYKEVPNGVFRYAAYEFEVDGQTAYQFVIDWMGEYPMDGSSFTYVIEFDPSRGETGDIVRLIDVKKDY